MPPRTQHIYKLSKEVWTWLEARDPDWVDELRDRAKAKNWPEGYVSEQDWNRLGELALTPRTVNTMTHLIPLEVLMAGGGLAVGLASGADVQRLTHLKEAWSEQALTLMQNAFDGAEILGCVLACFIWTIHIEVFPIGRLIRVAALFMIAGFVGLQLARALLG